MLGLNLSHPGASQVFSLLSLLSVMFIFREDELCDPSLKLYHPGFIEFMEVLVSLVPGCACHHAVSRQDPALHKLELASEMTSAGK